MPRPFLEKNCDRKRENHLNTSPFKSNFASSIHYFIPFTEGVIIPGRLEPHSSFPADLSFKLLFESQLSEASSLTRPQTEAE